jgi:hypothetical protein
MEFVNQFRIIGIIFLGTVGFGLWVSRLGKPYHNLLFNIHKLVALAGVVLVVMRLIKLDPFVSFSLLALILIGAAFAGVLAMFISGALLSIQDEISRLVQLIHQISAGVIALTSLAALFVLN